MANPFAKSRTFHRIGHVTNTIPLKAMTPGGIAVVTTTGRKSGRRRARAMRAVRDGDRLYAVSILGPTADWVANLKADPNVTVKVGGTTYRATGRVITDPQELQKAADAYRPIAGWYDYFDYANFVWSIPGKSKLLRAHDEWFKTGTPVVFELNGEAP
jgi:deazaflavin-dependent oxidoreductase (nitroreductase family)